MFCPFWNKCNLLNLNVDLCFDSGKVAGLLISKMQHEPEWGWWGGNLYNMEFCDIFSSSRVEFNKSILVSVCEETNLYEALDGLSWNSQLLQEEATRYLELITGNLPINWLLHHSMQILILELHQILKKHLHEQLIALVEALNEWCVWEGFYCIGSFDVSPKGK